MVHYFKPSPFYDEYSKLNEQYPTALNLSFQTGHNPSNSENVLNFLKTSIKTTLNNIKLNTNNVNRVRRWIFNGLGTIIKSITGNLNAKNEEKWKDVTRNNKIRFKIIYKYSTTSGIIKNFNNTINNNTHNTLNFKKTLNVLETTVRNGLGNVNKMMFVNILNEIQVLYSLLLNTIQEIENSITFCKLKTEFKYN